MHKTEQRKEQFIKEFSEFLEKWNAEIDIQDDYITDEHIIITVDAVYKPGIVRSEQFEIDCGRYIDSETIELKPKTT